jgi:hypothetical protein
MSYISLLSRDLPMGVERCLVLITAGLCPESLAPSVATQLSEELCVLTMSIFSLLIRDRISSAEAGFFFEKLNGKVSMPEARAFFSSELSSGAEIMTRCPRLIIPRAS